MSVRTSAWLIALCVAGACVYATDRLLDLNFLPPWLEKIMDALGRVVFIITACSVISTLLRIKMVQVETRHADAGLTFSDRTIQILLWGTAGLASLFVVNGMLGLIPVLQVLFIVVGLNMAILTLGVLIITMLRMYEAMRAPPRGARETDGPA